MKCSKANRSNEYCFSPRPMSSCQHQTAACQPFSRPRNPPHQRVTGVQLPGRPEPLSRPDRPYLASVWACIFRPGFGGQVRWTRRKHTARDDPWRWTDGACATGDNPSTASQNLGNEPRQPANSSLRQLSMNAASGLLIPRAPAAWPQIEGMTLSSAFGINPTSISLSSGGK